MSTNNDSSSKKNSSKVLDTLKGFKNNVEGFMSEVSATDLRKSVNTMIKDAQKDFSKLVQKDLNLVKKKFHQEKNTLEKKFSSTLNQELTKAKKFIDIQKREINSLQKKLEKMIQAKAPVKKVAKKKTVKKASKKVTRR